MFAVVQNDQQVALADVREQGVLDGLPRRLRNAEHRCDDLGHEPRIRGGCKLDEPDAVGIVVDDAGSDLQRQPRFAEAAGSDERDQARSREQRLDLGRLALATDERRDLLGQVVRRRLQRSQRRKRLAQRRVDDLVHALRMRKIAQPYEAEVAQADFARNAITDQVDGRLRHEDLPTVRGVHDPRGTVDGAAEEVAVAALDDPRVQATSHGERNAGRRVGIGQRLLQLECGTNAVERILERRVNAVACRLDDQPAQALDRFAGERVVPGECRTHAVGLSLP
jgi:hypothetical protein